jgi:hypothetical protein
MPVSNVIVLHSTNAEFLQDVESLKSYIQEELNCISLETSMDEVNTLFIKLTNFSFFFKKGAVPNSEG